MKNKFWIYALIVSTILLIWQFSVYVTRTKGAKDAGVTTDAGVITYPAEPNRTIDITVITEYHIKSIIPKHPFGHLKAATGTVIYSGTFELPYGRMRCVSCVRKQDPEAIVYIPQSVKQYIRRYRNYTDNKITVEKKTITGLRKDFRCNRTLRTHTCGNNLTDGSIIIQHKWGGTVIATPD